MLASNGEIGEPCGVPASFAYTIPPSNTPARTQPRSSLNIRRIGDAGNPERPQLAWPARLRDTNSPQRLRPVGPGPELRGALFEELAPPELHDAIDGHAIDARSSSVGTDLAPSPPEHVAAGDLVIQGVETTILILLGTAVEHALESTNPVHARGVADGS